ncbi:hypothetical protein CAPTEDRAFT_95668 [Capitella teleta]|uniref:Small monomeric GTPase n=1 Tax=Capitella teleta TaxID=283909 RepID=R7UM26_CAPTE|nr:hypothetical protein CAPTEDRAFT_95668 [Capitella teleta]|eukprot:ELU07285.1 hypothetical protein CAPTEDRAFT_95668 [Capitella teleta]
MNDVVEKVEGDDDDESQEYTHFFKILLVGAARVGKTAVRYRFCRGHYADEYYPTSGLENSARTVRINGDTVRLQIMDVGGDRAYETTRKNYYRGANAFIVVYDVNNKKSFENAQQLVKELDMHEQSEAPKMILANKCDFSKRRVDQDEAKSWADGWRLPLVESSTRTGQGIDDAVLRLAVALKRQLAPWKRLYNFD